MEEIPIRVEKLKVNKFCFDFENYKNILWLNTFRQNNLERTVEIIRENNKYDKIILISYNEYDFVESEKNFVDHISPCKYINSDGCTTDKLTKEEKPKERFKNYNLNYRYCDDSEYLEEYDIFKKEIDKELNEDCTKKIFIIGDSKFKNSNLEKIFKDFHKKIIEKNLKLVYYSEDINLLDMVFDDSLYLYDTLVFDVFSDYYTIFTNIIRKNFDSYLTDEFSYIKDKEQFEDISSYFQKNNNFMVFSKIDKKIYYADKKYTIRLKNKSSQNSYKVSSDSNQKSDSESNSIFIKKSEEKSIPKFFKGIKKSDSDSNSVFIKKTEEKSITNTDSGIKNFFKDYKKSNEKNNFILENSESKEIKKNITINLNIKSVKDNDITININI